MNICFNSAVLRRTYIFIFAVSGFSGLIYESVWSHYLKLFLGHAAYAQTLVLIIFMGGMAVGAWGAARYGGRIQNILIGYAVVEMCIGLFALLFHPVFIELNAYTYQNLLPLLESAMTIKVVKVTMAGILILPQSVLLGATFPFMAAGIIRRFPGTPGQSLAVMYFANSFGAAFGVLFAGFFLIAKVGLPGTIITAGLINIMLAIIVLSLCYLDRQVPSLIDKAESRAGRSSSKLNFAAFLACAAVTGTASFLYEIGWIRMLSLVLGSSTHAFELMLSAFIAGLAFGGYWIKKHIDKLSDPVKTLGWIQIFMGLLALSTILSYSRSFDLMDYILKVLNRTDQGYVLFNFLSHAISMLIMLPATFCAGMTLPLLTYLLIAKGHGERSIGAVYASNTLGSILGVLLGVHLIMPVLGLKNVIIAGSGIDIILGIILLWYAYFRVSRIKWVLIASFSFAAWLGFILFADFNSLKMASGVYLYGLPSLDAEILYHKDGKTASIDLIRSGGKLILRTNGKPDAGLGEIEPAPDDLTTVLLAALPLSIDSELQKAAVIGLGSGMTSHVLLTAPGVKQVDTIEIEPAIVEAARGFGSKVSRVFNDPRSKIHIEDAKVFFSSQHSGYDLIVSEPSNPWVSGIASVFSLEFYSQIRQHLRDQGYFVQWLHLYHMDINLVASVLKALAGYFEDYAVYFSVEGDLIIVARKSASVPEPDGKIFDLPEMAALLNRIGLYNIRDLQLRRLGSRKIFGPLINSYPVQPNSDYFPLLDLGAVKARFMKKDAVEINRLRLVPVQLTDILEGNVNSLSQLSFSNSSFTLTGEQAMQAMQIYQYYRNSTTVQDASLAVPKKIVDLVQKVKTIHQPCASRDMAEDWLPALKKLAKAVLPFLSPVELAVIWQDIESAACFGSLPQNVRNWVDLYKAVGEKDFAAMSRISAEMLPAGEILSTRDNDYLLLIAMLSQIGLDNPAAAVDLWHRYGGRYNPNIELRTVAAFAFAQ